MKKILRRLFGLKPFPHIHIHIKPIASQYAGFSCRRIIFECPCGDRAMEKVCRSFSDPFPIDTNHFITNEQMAAILNGAQPPSTPNPLHH